MRVARIRGVEIKANPILVVLLVIGAYLGYFAKEMLLILTVLLHEAAHSTVAWLLGSRVREIELLPLGGIVRVEGLFQSDPSREAIIAIAGPVFNIVLVFFVTGLKWYDVAQHYYASFFVATNIVIAVFNLIPVLPLDGGRVLRAVLSYRWGVVKATKWVEVLSKVIAVSMVMIALYRRFVYPLDIAMAAAAVFLFFASGTERKISTSIFINQVASKKKQLFSQGMLKSRSIAVAYNVSAKRVINGFLPGYYHIVFVIGDKGEIIGKIGEDEIFQGMMKYGYDVRVDKLLYNSK